MNSGGAFNSRQMKRNLVISVLPLLLPLDDCEVIDKVSNCPLKEEVSDPDSDKDFRLASLDIDD